MAAPTESVAGSVTEPAWPPAEVHSIRLDSGGLSPAADLRLFRDYLAILRRVRPDAYLSFTPKPNIYGSLAAGLLGIPAFPNVSGLGTAFIRGGALQLLVSRLYRIAFRRAPVVFFQNGEDRALFIERGMVKASQTQLLPGSGVDLDRFRPPPCPPGAKGRTDFLFVGRMLGDKGVRELAGAARIIKRSHPDVTIRLLGPAGAANRTSIGLDEIRGWEREGLLEFLYSHDDVRPFIAAADAVVLPSYREGMPRALLEASAMGRALIASDVPGCREIVREGVNGFLCEVRSEASLAGAMARFITLSPDRKARMGQEARRVVELEFSEEKVIQAYLSALEPFSRLRSRSSGA